MKFSAFMVRPNAPIDALEPQAAAFIRWFLFEFMRPLDAAHGKRWIRWWAPVFNRGEGLQAYPITARHGKFHAMHMTVETRLFEHQDGFIQLKAFREWLKTGAVFGKFVATPVGLVFEPSSLKYEDCSDDEMREFHADALEFLRTPHALHTLWPHMTLADAGETLELLLKKEHE